MSKKIIITGALGFIGSNLLYSLEQNGYTSVIAVDWFGKDERWKNAAKRSAIKFISPEKLMEYISNKKEDIKAIIHLGAISSTTETDGDLIMATNYSLSIELFEFAKEYNIQFIYASSAATYGNGQNGFEDIDTIEYLSNLRPLNLYGWSKNQFDLYVAHQHGFSEGCQTVALKFFNVYGPNEYHKKNQMSVINSFFEQASTQREIKLFQSNDSNIKDGEQSRDFVYVSDCVKVILWFLSHPNTSGIFNVGTGNATTFNEVANVIRKQINVDAKLSYIPIPESIDKQYQNYTCANISKLRKVGYDEPMTLIIDGVSSYIKNFLTQQDKYK